ncbi:hypothetical protein LY78DRAFT_345560 [Colletotrichum sublineola]|nr:hypothetical protein LY78DRAFT_345560 [Colletotrichum sublineola]
MFLDNMVTRERRIVMASTGDRSFIKSIDLHMFGVAMPHGLVFLGCIMPFCCFARRTVQLIDHLTACPVSQGQWVHLDKMLREITVSLAELEYVYAGEATRRLFACLMHSYAFMHIQLK